MKLKPALLATAVLFGAAFAGIAIANFCWLHPVQAWFIGGAAYIFAIVALFWWLLYRLFEK